MEKEFITYEQALALKELGFDEPCFGFYYPNGKLIQIHTIGFPDDKKDCILAPLYQQAFRWFRDKYLLDSIIQPTYSTKYQYRVIKTKVQVYGDYMGKEFSSFEEAELECLKKLIELVKSK
jgi:hypothetical protein